MKPIQVQTTVDAYMDQVLPDSDTLLTRLERQAQQEKIPIIGRQEAVLLQILARLSRPDVIVELGTATGYSGIWLLRGWPAARLITFELDAARAAQARNNFAEAGIGDRVEVREENAVEGLQRLEEGSAGLVFNDLLNGLRDTERVESCFRHSLDVLKVGGLLLADNALAAGEVVRPKTQQARSVHRWNELVTSEPSLLALIVPVGDGLSVAIRS